MYQVFLGYMPLPVAPAKIDISTDSRNETLDLVSGEEISILKQPGLKEIHFEFMIPSQEYPFTTMAGSLASDLLGNLVGLVESTSILKYLEQLKTDKEVFQFIVVRLGMGLKITNLYNTNIKVTLEDYTIKEDADNGFDIMVDVYLREWKDWYTKQYDPTNNSWERTRP